MMKHTYPAKIIHKKQETSSVFSLELEVQNPEKFQYEPAQYISVFKDTHTSRSYSLSSHPTKDKNLQITIKKMGLVSNFISEKKEGDTLHITPPQGNFFRGTQAKIDKIVIVGAGSGMAPLLSILKEFMFYSDKEVIFVASDKNSSSLVFYPYISDLKTQFGNRLKTQFIWTDERPRLTEKDVQSWIVSYDLKPSVTEFYLCGPEGFMEKVKQGLPPQYQNINTESFLTKTPTDHLQGTTKILMEEVEPESEQSDINYVDENKESHTIKTPSNDMTILEAMLAEGVDAPYSCMSGNCLACISKLKDGTVYMEPDHSLSQSEIKQNLILTCKSKAISKEVHLSYEDLDI